MRGRWRVGSSASGAIGRSSRKEKTAGVSWGEMGCWAENVARSTNKEQTEAVRSWFSPLPYFRTLLDFQKQSLFERTQKGCGTDDGVSSSHNQLILRPSHSRKPRSYLLLILSV